MTTAREWTKTIEVRDTENSDMRVFAAAIALTLCFCGVSLAQTPVKPRATSPQAARVLPKPSPAELRRCALPPKLLNAVARSACKGYTKKHG
jgi:hypothetical protein